jgi:hypothetical protein
MTVQQGRSPTTRDLFGLAVGLAGSAAATTMVFLGMRAVMDVGGSCASGGPYVIANPCPTGSDAGVFLGIFLMLGSWGVAAYFGSRVGGLWSNAAIFGWAGLFISLGWNFLEAAFSAEGGVDPTGILMGAMFWAMGGIPLIVVLLATAGIGGRSSSRSESAARQVPEPGPGFSPFADDHVSHRNDPTPAALDGQEVRDQLMRAISRDLDAVGARPADGSTAEPGSDADPTRDTAALAAHLERLADLHAKGMLDDAEYATAKSAILKALEGIS